MAGSSPVYDDAILEFFRAHTDLDLLDLGPGTGKMGKIYREAGGKGTAIGIDMVNNNPGIAYDKLIWAEFVEYVFKDTTPEYGIVALGDSLEHLRKSDGVDLLEYLTIKSHYIVIKHPVHDFKYDLRQAGGDDPETHRSNWSERDFGFLDPVRLDYRPFDRGMRLAIITGFREQCPS